jgi:hypothetical protein
MTLALVGKITLWVVGGVFVMAILLVIWFCVALAIDKANGKNPFQ